LWRSMRSCSSKGAYSLQDIDDCYFTGWKHYQVPLLHGQGRQKYLTSNVILSRVAENIWLTRRFYQGSPKTFG
jgi:hypothetical protein